MRLDFREYAKVSTKQLWMGLIMVLRSSWLRSRLVRWATVIVVSTSAVACVVALVDSHDAYAKASARKKKTSRGRHAQRGPSASAAQPRPIERTPPYTICPADMVSIRGMFCIDRYEAAVVDLSSGNALSPYYPPHPRLLHLVLTQWTAELERELAPGSKSDSGLGMMPLLVGAERGARWTGATELLSGVAAKVPSVLDSLESVRAGMPSDPDAGVSSMARHDAVMPLPEVPQWELLGRFSPKAVSRASLVPQGYVPGFTAHEACRNAGKRLCRENEWVTACRGERGWKFPYGNTYKQGACNVFRDDHPARILHGSASAGLSDPRLNTVTHDGTQLLRETGGSPLCSSVWGKDAVYDMVGNLDEWVDDPEGVFVGGFYSRATRNGCEARVSAHGPSYFDYSLGFRCCADLAGAY